MYNTQTHANTNINHNNITNHNINTSHPTNNTLSPYWHKPKTILNTLLLLLSSIITTPTLANTTPTTTTNTHAQFNGNNQYLQLPNAINTNQTFYNASNTYTGFTYLSWVKYNQINPWSRLLDFSAGGNANYNVIIVNEGRSNNLIFEVYNARHSSGKAKVPNFFPINQGIHLAVVQQPNGSITIYKNGTTISHTGNTGKIPNNINLIDNYIGRSNWSNDAYLNANLNDTAIFNSALSQAQIQTAMSQGLETFTSDNR